VHQQLNGINRRGAIRRKPKGVEVSCRQGALGVGPDLAITLRSISESGARLLLTTRLKAGEEVEIELRSSNAKTTRLMAEVVRSIAVPGNVYCTAVRFQKRLSYGEFTRMT
jgi:hypothetical protein